MRIFILTLIIALLAACATVPTPTPLPIPTPGPNAFEELETCGDSDPVAKYEIEDAPGKEYVFQNTPGDPPFVGFKIPTGPGCDGTPIFGAVFVNGVIYEESEPKLCVGTQKLERGDLIIIRSPNDDIWVFGRVVEFNVNAGTLTLFLFDHAQLLVPKIEPAPEREVA